METNQHKVKLSCVFIGLLCCFALCVGKLYFIQIHQAHFFSTMGKQQYKVKIVQTPQRAPIFDRTGTQALAINRESLSAFIVPNSLKDSASLARFLKKQFPQAYERLARQADKSFMYIKRHLTPEQQACIEQAKLDQVALDQVAADEVSLDQVSTLADIQFLKESKRFYPIEAIGPIIGITDADNRGITGLELLYNDMLAGTPTTSVLEQDARSGHFYFKKETETQGITGHPLYLTLDSTLQFLAYNELRKTLDQFNSPEGAVLIMNPDNGDILAMVNYPDFDPQNTEELNLEHTKNRIVTETYELGSVMKTFFACACLAEGVVTPDTKIDCENKKHAIIDGMRVNNHVAHGILSFSEVIENSNNIGTAKVAVKIGPKLYDHYLRCGFGKKTGITFPGEQKGHVTHPSTWSKQSLASLSYGYEIRATLLQLGCAFCMLANNGFTVKPRLLLTAPIEKATTPVYSEKTMREMREILTKTTTQGTAKKARMKGYSVMGKTGTANLIVNGKYQPDRNIFTFAGIVEKGQYKRVIIAFVKEASKKDIFAATVAVPLFEQVAERMVINDRVID